MDERQRCIWRLHPIGYQNSHGHPYHGSDVYNSNDDNVGGDNSSHPNAHARYGLFRVRLGLL